MLNKKDLFIIFLFFLIGIVSRFPLVENYQSHWDGPDYSIAVVRYSLEQNTPTIPGYPLYIGMGRLFYFLTHDPHRALLFVNILWSGIGASVFYIVGKIMFNRVVGIISASIFLSGSTFYYFGLTPYPHLILPISTALLGLLSYLVSFKNRKLGVIFGVVFALTLGIRPQEFLFTFPLILFGFFHLSSSQKIRMVGSFLITFFLWFIPFLMVVGGLGKYLSIIAANSDSAKSVYALKIRWEYIELIVKGVLLSLGVGILFMFFYLRKALDIVKRKKSFFKLCNRKVLFFLIWIIPSLFFNVFIITVHAGYQMNYLSALMLLTSYGMWEMLKKNKYGLIAAIVITVGINLLLFFYNRDPKYVKPYRPTSFHYTDIRANDKRFKAKINFMDKHFSPKNTIILTTPTLWRPYMYYFKDYKIFEVDALKTWDKQFVDVRRDGQYWIKREYKATKHMIAAPEKIENIVLLDDEEVFQIINTKSTLFKLDGGSLVYVIPVRQGDTFSYGFHFLEKINSHKID